MDDQATERMIIDATPDVCYEVAADIARYPQWAADIKDVVVDESDSEGRAERVSFRAGAFGRSISYTLEYDYSRAPEILSWTQTDGDLTSKLDGSYAFSPSGVDKTEVVYTLEVEMRVPLPGFIKRRAHSRIMHTALEDLRDRVQQSRTS